MTSNFFATPCSVNATHMIDRPHASPTMSVLPISGLNFRSRGGCGFWIEFQGRQVEAEGRDVHGGLTDVHSVYLLMQYGADQFSIWRSTTRTDTDEPAQGFDQENTGPTRQVENGFRAGQSLRNLIENQGNERQPSIEYVLSVAIVVGRQVFPGRIARRSN